MGIINIGAILNSIIFAGMGMAVFAFGFYFFDKLTPYHLWKQIVDEKNVALAIVVGAVSIGISMIIAASVHG